MLSCLPRPKTQKKTPRYPRAPILVALAMFAAGSATACGAIEEPYDEVDASDFSEGGIDQDGGDGGADADVDAQTEDGRVFADAGID
jgi:hypothetical protein